MNNSKKLTVLLEKYKLKEMEKSKKKSKGQMSGFNKNSCNPNSDSAKQISSYTQNFAVSADSSGLNLKGEKLSQLEKEKANADNSNPPSKNSRLNRDLDVMRERKENRFNPG